MSKMKPLQINAGLVICFLCMILSSCSVKQSDIDKTQSSTVSETIDITDKETIKETIEETEIESELETESETETESESETETESESETELESSEPNSSDEDDVELNTDVNNEWNEPFYMYSRKYPFVIDDVVYSEDGKTIYIISDESEIYAINTADGETKKVYYTDYSVYKLIEQDDMLYIISSKAVEIWDIDTDKKINTIFLNAEEIDNPDTVYDCAIVGDYLVMAYPWCSIGMFHLKNGSSKIYHIASETILDSITKEEIACIIDENHSKVYFNLPARDDKGYVYCYDLITGEIINTFPSDQYSTEIYVNEITGTFYLFYKDGDNEMMNCKLYDTEYNLIRELSWSSKRAMLSGFYPADVTADDSIMLINDAGYGRILIVDLNNAENYMWIENFVKDYKLVNFSNTGYVFMRGSSRQPWKLFDIDEQKYREYSEITGNLNYREGGDTFVMYKDNGMISVYYNPIESCVEELTYFDRDNILTNSTWSMRTTISKFTEIVAISPDSRYTIEIRIPEDEEAQYSVKVDKNIHYWIVDSEGEIESFNLKFPDKKYLLALAVKDDTRAAAIDMLGVYYEFNPRNGEIYSSGTLEMPPDTELDMPQLVVDFDNSLASVTYRVTNNGFEGALYSTKTYKQVFYYGETYSSDEEPGVGHGYMIVDAKCEKVYYRDSVTKKHLVLTLPQF